MTIVPGGHNASVAAHIHATLQMRWKEARAPKDRRYILSKNANGSFTIALEGTQVGQVLEANPDRICGYYQYGVRLAEVADDIRAMAKEVA